MRCGIAALMPTPRRRQGAAWPVAPANDPDAVQIGALLDEFAIHNPPMADFALVIIGTGLRRSEVLGLRFADRLVGPPPHDPPGCD